MASAELQLAAEMIERFELELSNLSVFTEAASGPYLWTPLLAALAGAERVFALTADSPHASAGEVVERTSHEADSWGVADSLEIGFERSAAWIRSSDIVTNSGFVRPIDAEFVARLKPTAVIPLMWETWEFRPDDLDLEACRGRGIPVIGTRESQPPCDMRPFLGELGLNLLAELGVEGGGGTVALLGGQQLIGGSMRDALVDGGYEVIWFAADAAGAAPYEQLDELVERADQLDAILVAEHHDPTLLVGTDGALDPSQLAEANPGLRIGVIAGNVDAEALRAADLGFAPDRIRPFGQMSYQPAELGPEPVLMLYAAGLKVGEVMARARLAGEPPEEAARRALESAPGMDFPGERAWVPA